MVLLGEMEIPMPVVGSTEMLALADLVVSATLVAVSWTLVLLVTVGAVNSPLGDTVPADAIQVTAVLAALVTVA